MSAGQITSPNPVLDSTEDPFNPNSFSDVTGRDPETYQVRNDYTEHPGFVGFQLQDRPSISTLRIYNGSDSDDSNDSNIYGTELTVIQTGTPNASQVKVNASNGWCQTHISNLNMYFIAVYDSRGTNNAFDSVDQRVTDVVEPLIDAAVDAAVLSAIATEVPAAVVAELASYDFPYPPKHIAGLILTNNVTDPTNDIDVAAGSARDATDAENIDYAGGTIQTDVAFGTGNGSLDTGAVGNGTYHVWLIKRSDTGVSKILTSLSASAPTMPANYDYKQRIGAIVRNSGAILPFVHDGYDTFRYVTPIADVAATNPGTSAVTRTLTLPTGITDGIAIVIHALESPAGTNTLGVLTALDETDTAPSTSYNDTGILSGNPGYGNISGTERRVKINTSAQIRSRVSGSSASVTEYITTIGWIDRRVI